MNEKNLKPQSERTKEEQREIARKGGIKSGQARREKRTIQQILKQILESDGTTLSQFATVAKKLGLESDKSIKEIYAVICLLNSVKSADLGDLEKLQRLMGEDKQDANADVLEKLDGVIKGVDDLAE